MTKLTSDFDFEVNDVHYMGTMGDDFFSVDGVDHPIAEFGYLFRLVMYMVQIFGTQFSIEQAKEPRFGQPVFVRYPSMDGPVEVNAASQVPDYIKAGRGPTNQAELEAGAKHGEVNLYPPTVEEAAEPAAEAEGGFEAGPENGTA